MNSSQPMTPMFSIISYHYYQSLVLHPQPGNQCTLWMRQYPTYDFALQFLNLCLRVTRQSIMLLCSQYRIRVSRDPHREMQGAVTSPPLTATYVHINMNDKMKMHSSYVSSSEKLHREVPVALRLASLAQPCTDARS